MEKPHEEGDGAESDVRKEEATEGEEAGDRQKRRNRKPKKKTGGKNKILVDASTQTGEEFNGETKEIAASKKEKKQKKKKEFLSEDFHKGKIFVGNVTTQMRTGELKKHLKDFFGGVGKMYDL